MTISMDSKLYKYHSFDKISLVTEVGGYDLYRCKNCGVKGKRYGVINRLSFDQIDMERLSLCNEEREPFDMTTYINVTPKIEFLGPSVKIIDDTNLKEYPFYAKIGDVYQTVEAPNKEDSELSGLWVIGNSGNRFRLLPNEYIKILRIGNDR